MSDIERTKTVGIERNENPHAAFEDLLAAHRKKKQEAKAHGSEWLEDRINELPERAKVTVREFEKQLVDGGVTDSAKLAALVERNIIAFEQTYQDKRFTVGEGEHMLNKGYAKEQAIGWLKGVLDKGDPTPEDLKKVALMNFDANGLKAVNDLSASHERGTEYLKRIAEVFHDPKSETALWLQKQGINDILPVTAGGDEYSVAIRSDKPISAEVISEAVTRFEGAIAAIDVSDLVDFSDRTMQLRYFGTTEKEYKTMSDAERKKIDARITKEIPQDFRMRSSAPGGGATLFEGLLSAMRHDTKPIKADDAYGQKLDKIMGGMWDTADGRADSAKKEFKSGLGRPESGRDDNFYSKVLLRTTEARILEAKLEHMTLQLKRREVFDADMRQMEEQLEEGLISPKQYIAVKRRKEEELQAAEAQDGLVP